MRWQYRGGTYERKSSQVDAKVANLLKQTFGLNNKFDWCKSDQLGNCQLLRTDPEPRSHVPAKENGYVARYEPVQSTERFVRFQVPTLVRMKMAAFWDIAP
jgi:hypothetical protein